MGGLFNRLGYFNRRSTEVQRTVGTYRVRMSDDPQPVSMYKTGVDLNGWQEGRQYFDYPLLRGDCRFSIQEAFLCRLPAPSGMAEI